MCKYCSDEDGCNEAICRKDVSVLNNKIPFEIYISVNNLNVCASDEYAHPIMRKKIKYCPMCGEKLNEWNSRKPH